MASTAETHGKCFLLENDVRRRTEMAEFVLSKVHAILRHFARIKEIRGGKQNRIIISN